MQEDQAERIDERDTMFARITRVPGTPPYSDYYERNPGHQAVDDRLRQLPRLCRPGGKHHDAEIAAETERYFEQIGEFTPSAARVADWTARIEAAADPAVTLEALALEAGAVAAGIAPLDPRFVYTHKGRFDEDYGRRIELEHRAAIVFLVEMDHDAMQHAPRAPTLRESARQYLRAAEIALTLTAALEAAGCAARAQYDAHYDVILPPLAVLAGLGELGRNNILVADRFGSRVRIGAVTTDLMMRFDSPVDLGVARFCDVCRKCATSCPSASLDDGRRATGGSAEKWSTRVETCYGYWLQMGTDCGICMATCPFSHRDTRVHSLVRWLVRRLGFLNRLAVLGDSILYGRKWKRRES